MNIYEQIRKIRNNKLYNGNPPLEFGCEVEDGYNYKIIEVGVTIGNVQETTVIDLTGRVSSKKSSDNFKILGKPVSLNDVLLMLCTKKYGGIITNYQKFRIYTEINLEIVLRKFKDQNSLVEIDLSKEIKDQDEEVLKKLLELVK